jgi:hypothetical protein
MRRSIMRTIVGILALALTLLVVGCVKTPAVTSSSVTPSGMRYPGGTITVTATVVPGDAALIRVWAAITKPDGTTPTIDLSQSAGIYTETWKVPANTRTDGIADTYHITVWASDANGKQGRGAEQVVTVNAAGTPPATPSM